MTIKKVGSWATVRRILRDAPRKLDVAIKKSLRQEGQFFRTKIVEGIREQAPGGKPFTPLSPNTLRVRRFEGFGGTKALIRSGDLRNAVVVVEISGAVFVGILRTAKNRDGESLANIADIHENGRGPFLVPITPKSRGFLRAAGVVAPLFVAVIRIPARPFIRPVFEKFGKTEQVRERILRRLGELMRRDLGGV